MGTIRSFIAIPLKPDIIDRIEKVQKELRSLRADVKWVRPQSIHFTLKFLGNIEESQISAIAQKIQHATGGYTSWPIHLKNLGTFPSLRNPRVIWVGIEDTSGQIVTLQRQIEHALSTLGFAQEKRNFSPHLTLGRVKSPRGKKDLIQYLIDEREKTLGKIQVDRVVLFRSELHPSGAIYTALKEFVFQEAVRE